MQTMKGTLMRTITTGILAGFLAFPPGLWATPQGGQVAAGQAVITQQGRTMAINQLSSKAVINWQGFDIAANELVQFMQPGANAVALNRVLGRDASQILGQLKANGRIFIVNPRGVLFGASARIDVGGLLATTLGIDDSDFMNGKFTFKQTADGETSLVVNSGQIKVADNGFAFLVAPTVDNKGLIVAKLGTVALASGDTLTIDFRGDGLVTYAVSGKLVDQLVKNSGTIRNPGGQVILEADTGSEVFAEVVNNDGIIEAQSLVERDGRILLSGGDGAVWNSGQIDVSGAEEGAAGGLVAISGRFAGTAGTIDAAGNGAADGGRVELLSERHSLVTTEANIDVSGGQSGSGGTVAVLSDNRSTLNGQIAARGGAQSGNGGFVDVSSPGEVELHGQVDASAPEGDSGALLIDPRNLEVAGFTGVVYDPNPAPDSGNNEFNDNPADTTIINVLTINNQLADVLLQANNDLTVTDPIDMDNVGIGVTLQAGRSVLINNDITTDDGAVTITANDPNAVAAQRDAGTAEIKMAAGTELDAGNGTIQLTVAANGHGDAGGVTVDSVTTDGNMTVVSFGAIGEVDTDDDVDLRANVLILTTTDPAGASIGAPGTNATDPIEVDVGTRLDMATVDAAVAVHRPRTGLESFTPFPLGTMVDFGLGTVNIGDATLILTVTNGNILDANADATPNITATAANLTADASNLRDAGWIGTSGSPIRTDLDILSASSDNNSIHISEADDITISTVHAMSEGGVAGLGPSGVETRDPDGNRVSAHTDVSISAGGSIGVDVITSTRGMTLNSGKAIYDLNEESGNITTPDLVLTGPDGLGQEPTDEGLALDIATNELRATSTGGGVFLRNTAPGTTDVVTLTSGGGNEISLTNGQDILRLGTVTANGGGDIMLHGGGGTITDGNGAAVNITGEHASITCSNGVGTGADPIDTMLTTLSIEVLEEGKSFHIVEADTLDEVTAKVKNGNADLTFAGGTFEFDANAANDTGEFSSLGAPIVSLENTGGDVEVATVNAATRVTIIADKAIVDSTSSITSGEANLTAGTGIGAAGSEINTDVDTLDATTREGSIFIRENDGLAATAVAEGENGNVDLATSNAGDISVVKITADDEIKLNAGGSILADAQTMRLSSASADLTAGAAIGTVADPLDTAVSTLSATANAGRLSLQNYGDLTLTAATAAGDDLELRNSGTMTLNTVTAAGQTATVHSNGTITDGNGAALNILADTLFLSSGLHVGAPGAGNAIDVDVASLNVPPTYGAVYINHLGATALNVVSVEAVGSGSDVELTAAGDINLGLVSAKGDDVVIVSGNAITDANGPDVNVVADTLDITGPGGIGLADPLETQVNQLSSSGDAVIANDGPLALTEAALEGGSSAFIAQTITILDIADNQADLANDVSLDLSTPAGHIVFLDRNDKIVASGTGTVSIDAGSATADSGGVAIIGDIETADTEITIKADSHITIGLLDAGAGDVSVLSNTGVILDGNGALGNIIARNLSLRGRLPTAREAELHTTHSIADAHAHDTEAATKKTLHETTDATAVVLEQAEQTQIEMRDAKQVELDDITVEVDELAARVAPLATTIEVMERTVQGMTVVADVLNLVGSIAQAVPLTGDGGLLGTAAAFETGIGVVETSLFYADIAYEVLAEDLEDLEGTQAELAAQLYTHQQLTDYSVEASRAADEAVSISSAAYEAAVVAQGLAWQVSRQAVAAEDIGNAIGTGSQNFGTQITGTIDAVADRSDIYIGLTGAGKLGTLNASNTASNAKIEVLGDGDISVDGAISAQSLIRIETTGGAIINGGGSVTSPELLALATAGVGTGGGLSTSVDTFAAAAGTGGVGLANDKALVIGTVDGTSGVTGDGSVSIATSSPLTVSQNVTSGNAIDLVAGNSNSAGDDLTVQDGVQVQGTAAVSLTAGDHVSLAANSAVSGTAITIIADNAGDGAADGVTGGVTAAGTITGSSVDITGGNLVHSGSIVSTGPVRITTISTGTSAVDGIQLADIQAAGQTVTISATGTVTAAITDANAGDRNILASDLALTGTAGVGTAADPLETEVSNLAADGGTGGVTIDNTGDLNLQTVSGVTTLSATGGAIALTTTGNLGISDAFVQGAGLDVTLTATGGSMVEIAPGAAADVVGSTVELHVTGAASTIGAGPERLEIDATLLNASTEGGGVWLEDTAGGVIVGLVTTTGAANSVVALRAIGGAITEAAATDPEADIVAEHIDLDVTGAASTVGTEADTLELDADLLDILTGGGSVWIEDTAGGVAVDLVSTTGAANSVVELLATGGAITEAAATDAGADIIAEHIDLDITGATSTVGTAADTLELDADVLDILTEGGSIWIEDTANGVSVGLVSTTGTAGSLIEFTATGGDILESAPDEAADLIAASLLLTVTGATSDIGAAGQPLELQVDNLSAFTQGGRIELIDLDGGVVIDELTTLGVAGSSINLTALNGSILETEPGDVDIDIWTEFLALTVTGENSVIGAPLNPIEIRAANFNPAGGSRVVVTDPDGELEVLWTLPNAPPDIIVVNGKVVGGGRIEAYCQARAVLRPYEFIKRFLGSSVDAPRTGELILPPAGSLAK